MKPHVSPRTSVRTGARLPALLLFPLLLACGCGSVNGLVDPGEDPEESACETVLRYLFENNSASDKNPQAIFIEVLEEDPSPDLLARFSGYRVPVKPVSAASPERTRGVTDRATGAKGLIFRIDDVRLEDDGGVTVKGGYYEASLSASGSLFRLARRGDVWTVVQVTPLWIS